MSSLASRSIAVLEQRGYFVKKSEFWNSFAHKLQDLWGFDLQAIKPGEFLLVQVTDDAHYADHQTKLAGLPHTYILKQTPVRLVIHRWGKHGARGKRKLWQLREEPLR